MAMCENKWPFPKLIHPVKRYPPIVNCANMIDNIRHAAPTSSMDPMNRQCSSSPSGPVLNSSIPSRLALTVDFHWDHLKRL